MSETTDVLSAIARLDQRLEALTRAARPTRAPLPEQLAGVVFDVVKDALADPLNQIAAQRVTVDALATELERLKAMVLELEAALAVGPSSRE